MKKDKYAPGDSIRYRPYMLHNDCGPWDSATVIEKIFTEPWAGVGWLIESNGKQFIIHEFDYQIEKLSESYTSL
jgi:hypothetical protein